MLEAGGNSVDVIAKAQILAAISRDHVCSSVATIRNSQELLAITEVYPFTTCIEPCCAFQISSRVGASRMATETAAELRARAAQARRIAQNIHSRQAQLELAQIADTLEAQADMLEQSEPPNPMPPSTNEL